MVSEKKNEFMQRALELAREGMNSNVGGPFGAVIVKEGKIIGEGNNCVTSSNDPTAHAEVSAIRDACKNLDTFQLDACDIYCTCEPCPMCLGAIYWARINKIFIASNRNHAADAGFDDSYIYKEFKRSPEERSIPTNTIMEKEGKVLFQDWKSKQDKTPY